MIISERMYGILDVLYEQRWPLLEEDRSSAESWLTVEEIWLNHANSNKRGDGNSIYCCLWRMMHRRFVRRSYTIENNHEVTTWIITKRGKQAVHKYEGKRAF